MIRGVLSLLFLMGFMFFSGAQTIKEDLPTNNTVQKKVNHRKYEPQRKNYDVLYTRKTKGTLYGNPCAIDVTHKMGFQYVPLTQEGKTKMGYFLNNLLVKTKLCVTRTPFWKVILNKRLDDCRVKSGDGIG